MRLSANNNTKLNQDTWSQVLKNLPTTNLTHDKATAQIKTRNMQVKNALTNNTRFNSKNDKTVTFGPYSLIAENGQTAIFAKIFKITILLRGVQKPYWIVAFQWIPHETFNKAFVFVNDPTNIVSVRHISIGDIQLNPQLNISS